MLPESAVVKPNIDQVERRPLPQPVICPMPIVPATPSPAAKMEKEVLGMLEGLAQYERPKKIAVLETDFSLERGEMTPTQKVKRRVVDRNYKNVIDAMYRD